MPSTIQTAPCVCVFTRVCGMCVSECMRLCLFAFFRVRTWLSARQRATRHAPKQRQQTKSNEMKRRKERRQNTVAMVIIAHEALVIFTLSDSLSPFFCTCIQKIAGFGAKKKTVGRGDRKTRQRTIETYTRPEVKNGCLLFISLVAYLL